MDHEQIGESEGHPTQQRRRPAQTQSPRQTEQTSASQPDVEDGQRLHHNIGRLAKEGKGQQVDRVEDARLIVGDERSSAVEVGVPERDDARPQATSGEAVDGPEEGDQVTTATRNPLVGEDQRPEEGENNQKQEAQTGYVGFHISNPDLKQHRRRWGEQPL